ncbi:hypothetical protein [Streptomyces sp. NPDC006334]|uniref:hypothetical protein n=1 Tax=Streptomyces sp. NPDC006334 TaxID=3156754 RepID=UPI0033AF816C
MAGTPAVPEPYNSGRAWRSSYVLLWNTSPTGLDERAGCRTVRDKQDSHRHLRQALSVRGRPVGMCAWADTGVRALVTVPGTRLPAGHTVSVRDYVQLGNGF